MLINIYLFSDCFAKLTGHMQRNLRHCPTSYCDIIPPRYHLVTRPFKGHQSKTVFLKCTQNTTMTAYSFNQNQFIANFNVLSAPLLLRTLQANSTYILSISSLVSITTSTSSPIFFKKHVPLTHVRYCRHGKQRI